MYKNAKVNNPTRKAHKGTNFEMALFPNHVKEVTSCKNTFLNQYRGSPPSRFNEQIQAKESIPDLKKPAPTQETIDVKPLNLGCPPATRHNIFPEEEDFVNEYCFPKMIQSNLNYDGYFKQLRGELEDTFKRAIPLISAEEKNKAHQDYIQKLMGKQPSVLKAKKSACIPESAMKRVSKSSVENKRTDKPVVNQTWKSNNEDLQKSTNLEAQMKPNYHKEDKDDTSNISKQNEKKTESENANTIQAQQSQNHLPFPPKLQNPYYYPVINNSMGYVPSHMTAQLFQQKRLWDDLFQVPESYRKASQDIGPVHLTKGLYKEPMYHLPYEESQSFGTLQKYHAHNHSQIQPQKRDGKENSTEGFCRDQIEPNMLTNQRSLEEKKDANVNLIKKIQINASSKPPKNQEEPASYQQTPRKKKKGPPHPQLQEYCESSYPEEEKFKLSDYNAEERSHLKGNSKMFEMLKTLNAAAQK